MSYILGTYCVVLFGLSKSLQLFQEAAKTPKAYPLSLQFSAGNRDENNMPYPIFVFQVWQKE